MSDINVTDDVARLIEELVYENHDMREALAEVFIRVNEPYVRALVLYALKRGQKPDPHDYGLRDSHGCGLAHIKAVTG